MGGTLDGEMFLLLYRNNCAFSPLRLGMPRWYSCNKITNHLNKINEGDSLIVQDLFSTVGFAVEVCQVFPHLFPIIPRAISK
jgi:hypothetical protein